VLAIGGKKKNKKEEQFFLDLLDFYKQYLGDTSRTVKKLSELQGKHKEQYKDFIEFQKDPSSILEIAKDIDTDAGAILFVLFARIAVISSKMMHIYDLDVDQQKKLSEDLTEFIKEIDLSIEKLKKKKEEVENDS
jgi:hypothetical protein